MTNSLHFSHRIKSHFNDQAAGDLFFSRRIKNHSYDQGNGTLTITFKNGTTQDYCKVSGKVYQELESSPDQNEYYNQNIFGNYQLGRIDWPQRNQRIRSLVYDK